MNGKAVLSFIVGTAIGSFVTWKIVKDKYAKIAQEEIDSVKEVFGKRATEETHESEDKKEDVAAAARHKVDICEYAKILNEEGYSSENDEKKGGEEPMAKERKPYVITPEEFSNGGYNVESLTYYADDVLTDDWGVVVEDPDELVGEDFASHFGEYEDDSVFVRNDEKQLDYEILRDLRNYWDTVAKEILQQDKDE